MSLPFPNSARNELQPLIVFFLALIALFLVNSGLMGANPFAALCLAACFVLTRNHDQRLFAAIAIPFGLLSLSIGIQDFSFSPEIQLLDFKYAVMALVLGGGFGYVIVLAIRSLKADHALSMLVGFSAVHAIWALIFVSYAPVESNVSMQGFSMQRQNIVAMPLLRFWSYDNQVIGITYFTVLPIACMWAAFPWWKKKKISAAILILSALLAVYCSAVFVTRIPLVVGVCTGGIYLLRELIKADWGKRIVLLALSVVAVIGAAAYLSQSGSIIVQEYIHRFTNVAEFGRLTIWSSALELIAQNPAGGARGSFLIDYYAHNCFLDWMMDFGWLVGGILSVAFISYFAWIGVLTLRKRTPADAVLIFMLSWSLAIGVTILIDPPTYQRMLYLVTSSTVALALTLTGDSSPERRLGSGAKMGPDGKLAGTRLR